MSPLVQLKSWPPKWAPLGARPLDEAVWDAWVVKARVRDAQNNAARLRLATWVFAAALVGTGVLGSYVHVHDVATRFAVVLAAVVVVLHCTPAKRDDSEVLLATASQQKFPANKQDQSL